MNAADQIACKQLHHDAALLAGSQSGKAEQEQTLETIQTRHGPAGTLIVLFLSDKVRTAALLAGNQSATRCLQWSFIRASSRCVIPAGRRWIACARGDFAYL
jgi:hypothetical protein